MSILREISQIGDTVKTLLQENPHLRDSDYKLICKVWSMDVEKLGYNITDMSAVDLLNLYSREKLSNAETIRRVRQKLQETIPELRGTIREERKQEAEKVRKEIKDIII